MSRRDEGDFPFAYLAEKPERSIPGNSPVYSASRNNPGSGSRSMTQQIQILMLIAFAALLIFLILLYITIMTITADSRNVTDQTLQTTISQSEVSTTESSATT